MNTQKYAAYLTNLAGQSTETDELTSVLESLNDELAWRQAIEAIGDGMEVTVVLAVAKRKQVIKAKDAETQEWFEIDEFRVKLWHFTGNVDGLDRLVDVLQRLKSKALWKLAYKHVALGADPDKVAEAFQAMHGGNDNKL